MSIIDLSIADNLVIVDMITQGPDEPMCCGTLEVVNAYELQDSGLVQVSSTPVEDVTSSPSDTIVGVLWQWTESIYGDDTSTTVDDP